jgi:hypothetical protein
MNKNSGHAVADSLGDIFIKTDVTSQDSQTAAFAQIWKKYSQIDFGAYLAVKPTTSIA